MYTVGEETVDMCVLSYTVHVHVIMGILFFACCFVCLLIKIFQFISPTSFSPTFTDLHGNQRLLMAKHLQVRQSREPNNTKIY